MSGYPARAPVLAAQGLALTYGGPVPVHAVRPASFEIACGDYVAILGPSGSGKSSLLNLLGLLDTATAGRYLVGGLDTGALSECERTALRSAWFGFVFQAFHLLAGRTLIDNVELALVYRRIPRGERRARAVEALTRVGLAHRVAADPSSLSGGERQRAAIARALVGRPAVLLCDEPTGNLDTRTAASVLDLVDELRRTSGLTTIVVTHDAAVAARASRRFSLVDGYVEEQG